MLWRKIVGCTAIAAVFWAGCMSNGWAERLDKVAILTGKLDDKRVCVSARAAKLLGDAKDLRAASALLGKLRSRQPIMRAAAAEALAKLGDKRAIDPLIDLLTDREKDVKVAAARALGELKAKTAVGALIGLLSETDGDDEGDENNELSAAAAMALGKIGDPAAIKALFDYAVASVLSSSQEPILAVGSAAVPYLLDSLKDPDPKRQCEAMWLLSSIGDPKAAEPMIRLLASSDSSVQDTAIACLGKLGGHRATQALAALLADTAQDPSIRARAASVYGNLMSPDALEKLMPLLDDPSEVVRQRATEGLARCGDTAAARLAIISGRSLTNVPTYTGIGEVGDLTGEQLLPWLLLAKDPDSAVRQAAVHTLADIYVYDPRVLSVVISAAKDTDPAIRELAANALGQYTEHDDAIEETLAAMMGDKDTAVRVAAVKAAKAPYNATMLAALASNLGTNNADSRRTILLDMWEKTPVERLIALLKDPDSSVKILAAIILGYINDERARPALNAALSDRELHGIALRSLMRLGDYDKLDLVAELLKSSDWMKWEDACKCLAVIKDKRAIEPLRKFVSDDKARSRALMAMARSGDHAAVMSLIEALKKLPKGQVQNREELHSPTRITRLEIIRALGDSGDRAATKPLLECCSLSADFADATDLVPALGKLADPACVDAMVSLLEEDNPAIRWNAAWVLAGIDDKRATDALIKGLNEWDTSVVGGGARYFIRHGIDSAMPIMADAMHLMVDYSTQDPREVSWDRDFIKVCKRSEKPELVEAARKFAEYEIALDPDDPLDWGGNPPKWAEAKPNKTSDNPAILRQPQAP